jgi:capsular polysaccharide biosynthesis protein
LVFDARWHNVVESVLDHQRYYSFRKTFRPRRITKRSGVYSSIQHPWHNNNWHWTADSLPQLRSLELHMQGRPLTLLMSSEVGPVHRASLETILPKNFSLEYVNPREWFELETFVLPSYVSSRASACFPPDYFDFIRCRTHLALGTPKPAIATGRYYISRERAGHRRILNEDEVVALIAGFGFKKIFMEDYTFAEQVALIRKAEAIVSPHGAGLGSIIYGDNLKVCVLYPEARPAGYFYTLAIGAGHQHFCTNANVSEHDDFMVDLDALRRVLTDEMELSPVA